MAANGAGEGATSTEGASKDVEKRDCRCESMLQKGLQTQRVVELREAMDKAGCSVPDTFFQCKPCAPNESVIGGFMVESDPQIVVCEDNVEKFNIAQSHVSRTMVHELIHAYDHCRAHVDWKDCLHIACSEVRAANLSGDCSYLNEARRRNFAVKHQGAQCVRRRAELSLQAHPHCADIAKRAVEQVLDTCIKDTAPFMYR